MPTMEWTRRCLLGTAAGAVASFAPGAAKAAGTKAMSYITPFGKIIAYAPDFVASANGYFEKAGVNVDIIGGNGSAQAIQLVAAGKALVGRTGGIDIVKAMATGNVSVRAIATISHASPFFVVSSPDKPIKTPKEMGGKKIGIVSRGGGTDNYLDIMLSSAGVSKDAVERQVAGNSPGAFDLIDLGRLDAFIADETVVIMLRKAGKNPLAWPVDDYASIPGQVYVASDEGIKMHREELIGFLRGVRDAVNFITAPGNMTVVLEKLKQFNLDELRTPDIAQASIEAQAKLWLAAGPQNLLRNLPDKWARGWHEMAAAGLVKDGDPSLVYTNDLVDAL
jgi:NitT/TauT family transport system substrate-binding protein